ncbi:hypothetical protein B0J18DRAFT_161088 [Chaetomium sp. MPI-SDFR-AT-0129]|nr:hypothetical protein B0J18DRAFT_161088 [Chaetomium sp. MPI-SDFR-AT-0129]
MSNLQVCLCGAGSWITHSCITVALQSILPSSSTGRVSLRAGLRGTWMRGIKKNPKVGVVRVAGSQALQGSHSLKAGDSGLGEWGAQLLAWGEQIKVVHADDFRPSGDTEGVPEATMSDWTGLDCIGHPINQISPHLRSRAPLSPSSQLSLFVPPCLACRDPPRRIILDHLF